MNDLVGQAKNQFNLPFWSNNFFDINELGEVVVDPQAQNTKPISLKTILNQLPEKINLPILLRFPQIIQSRITQLQTAFDNQIKKNSYNGHYQPVYPIKVNQQQQILQTIANQSIGLEAGSKPELLAILGTAKPNSLILCNGYKDRDFIQLAFTAQALGHNVIIILEKISELDLILEIKNNFTLQPQLGIRIKLNSISKGKWQNTGGEKSKFGLTTNQILLAINKLKENNYLSQLNLLHCHLGSQIANISDIQNSMQECVQYYRELLNLHCPIDTIDIGGGLAVDYSGTSDQTSFSMNYDLAEYASCVIKPLCQLCEEYKLPHPNIISESGRAMVAHHAILLTNVIDKENVDFDNTQEINKNNLIRHYHQIHHEFKQAQLNFQQGSLTLENKAHIEKNYYNQCFLILNNLNSHMSSHRELIQNLQLILAEKYFLNFSLFQSIPDSWAIDQIFPILPIENLDKPLNKNILLKDITCDSDGRIDNYVSGYGIQDTLLTPNKTNILAVFLVGAYQEILGDMHNLFGDTASATVIIDQDNQMTITNQHQGDTAMDLLSYLGFKENAILENISNPEYKDFIKKLLYQSTYLT